MIRIVSGKPGNGMKLNALRLAARLSQRWAIPAFLGFTGGFVVSSVQIVSVAPALADAVSQGVIQACGLGEGGQ